LLLTPLPLLLSVLVLVLPPAVLLVVLVLLLLLPALAAALLMGPDTLMTSRPVYLAARLRTRCRSAVDVTRVQDTTGSIWVATSRFWEDPP
jgi:hypothetical protein